MAAPCAAVPLPGGRPLPSGPMLMSHRARSASVTGLPSPGRSAATAVAAPPSASARGMTTARRSTVDMLDLPFVIGSPARDDVHVPHRESGHRNVDFGLAALREHLAAARFHLAGLPPAPALHHHRLALPPPHHSHPRERFAQHRCVERCLRPSL